MEQLKNHCCHFCPLHEHGPSQGLLQEPRSLSAALEAEALALSSEPSSRTAGSEAGSPGLYLFRLLSLLLQMLLLGLALCTPKWSWLRPSPPKVTGGVTQHPPVPPHVALPPRPPPACMGLVQHLLQEELKHSKDLGQVCMYTLRKGLKEFSRQ